MFNLLVDPYSIYESPRINGINTAKPALATHPRFWKPYKVRDFKPSAIIVGTSRSEVGLSPRHPGWGFQPTYNLGLPAASIYETLRHFQHAQSVNPLKQVVAGMDFFQFNIFTQPKFDFNEERLAVDRNGNSQPALIQDHFAALASLDALQDSIDTLTGQNLNANYSKNGMYEIRIKNTNQKKITHHRKKFRAIEKIIALESLKNFSFYSSEKELSVFDHYRTLLAMAHRNRTDLRILISPVHVRELEVIAVRGLWSTFEEWKRQLVLINEEQARKISKNPFPIWDFSDYNTYTTEKLPPLDDKESEMEWYWDSSHYKKELGDLIQDRIFNHNERDRAIAEDFGVQLSSENIEQHLMKIRQDREVWTKTHPLDVADIEPLKK